MAALPYSANNYLKRTVSTLSLNPFVGAVVAKTGPMTKLSSPYKWYDQHGVVWSNTSGTLSGVVSDNGTPVSHALVRCYYRPGGQLIASTWTASDGSFSFPGLDATDTTAFFVIAFDPDGGTQYNAIIFDRLTPV
jgi:hypothetical protein